MKYRLNTEHLPWHHTHQCNGPSRTQSTSAASKNAKWSLNRVLPPPVLVFAETSFSVPTGPQWSQIPSTVHCEAPGHHHFPTLLLIYKHTFTLGTTLLAFAYFKRGLGAPQFFIFFKLKRLPKITQILLFQRDLLSLLLVFVFWLVSFCFETGSHVV